MCFKQHTLAFHGLGIWEIQEADTSSLKSLLKASLHLLPAPIKLLVPPQRHNFLMYDFRGWSLTYSVWGCAIQKFSS